MASVPLLDEFGDEEEMQQTSRGLKHPYVLLSHIVFRGASILVYIFCGLFSDSFITSFVSVVLLLSVDFWIVKNVTGRILVGLRWWSSESDGKSVWIFESRNQAQSPNRNDPRETQIFWFGLVISPVLWGLFFLVALFGLKFKWILVVIIALALNGANLYGYIKCNFGANKDISSATNDFVRGQVFKNAVGLLTKTSQPPVLNSRSTGIV